MPSSALPEHARSAVSCPVTNRICVSLMPSTYHSRVLKPGGALRIMIYHHPSLTGFTLWLRYGLPRGQSLRQSVYDHLESSGTKSYPREEALALLEGFERVELQQVFSPGDLPSNEPSARFRGWVYRIIWRLYPRFLVRMLGAKLELFLLISARKPAAP
jgi:hypothetical protein